MTAALPRSVRLRTLNALMATMVGTAPQLRRDVDAVLRVFEADDDTDPGLGPEGLAAAATQMLKLLAPQQPVPAIARPIVVSVPLYFVVKPSAIIAEIVSSETRTRHRVWP